MGDPAILLQLFAAMVLAMVAAALAYAALATRNGWSPAGWGLALASMPAGAAVASAYRPELVILFVPKVLLLRGLSTWRWRRPTMILEALALFGWGSLLAQPP